MTFDSGPKGTYMVDIETPNGERDSRRCSSRQAMVALKHEYPVGTLFEVNIVGFNVSLTFVKDEAGFLV